MDGPITGVANAPGCDPNEPWLETVGASASTSNASIASSQTTSETSLLSQNFLSSSVILTGRGLSSQTSTNTGPASSESSSGSAAGSCFSSSGDYSTYTGTRSSGTPTLSTYSYTTTTGAPGWDSTSDAISAGSSVSMCPSCSSYTSITASVNAGSNSQISLSTASTLGPASYTLSFQSFDPLSNRLSPKHTKPPFISPSTASPGSSVSAGAVASPSSPITPSTYSSYYASGLGTTLSSSTSSGASVTESPGCQGTPQCVLVPKGFDDQCLDADWAYCYCSGSPAPLLTWSGSLVMPNCDYSTLPPSQCPGSPVTPFVPTGTGYSIIEVDGYLLLNSRLKRAAVPVTTSSSASCAVTSGAPTSFHLTISAILPCTGPTTLTSTAIASTSSLTPAVTPTPTPEICNGNNDPGLTVEQWQVQEVDAFWTMYFNNKTHWEAQGLMPQFFEDFSGGVPGDGINYICSAEGETGCQWLSSCSDIKTGPESWLTPYKIQAYYVWAGMEGFSKLINMIYLSLQWAAEDMNTFSYEVGQKFEVVLPGESLWSKIFPILNTILTLLAIVFIIADPFVDFTLAVSLRKFSRKVTRRLNVHL